MFYGIIDWKPLIGELGRFILAIDSLDLRKAIDQGVKRSTPELGIE
ncbi:MAG: hypothetical protein ACPF8V_09860 [Luteibaculum sp.]